MLLKTSIFGVFRWLRQYILDMRAYLGLESRLYSTPSHEIQTAFDTQLQAKNTFLLNLHNIATSSFQDLTITLTRQNDPRQGQPRTCTTPTDYTAADQHRPCPLAGIKAREHLFIPLDLLATGEHDNVNLAS